MRSRSRGNEGREIGEEIRNKGRSKGSEGRGIMIGKVGEMMKGVVQQVTGWESGEMRVGVASGDERESEEK